MFSALSTTEERFEILESPTPHRKRLGRVQLISCRSSSIPTNYSVAMTRSGKISVIEVAKVRYVTSMHAPPPPPPSIASKNTPYRGFSGTNKLQLARIAAADLPCMWWAIAAFRPPAVFCRSSGFRCSSPATGLCVGSATGLIWGVSALVGYRTDEGGGPATPPTDIVPPRARCMERQTIAFFSQCRRSPAPPPAVSAHLSEQR